jgi:phosphatidylinositol 4-kinase A
MLLQRLRSAEPTVEAAIAYNLVDLALKAPEGAFSDIIKVFSAINRSANTDDPRFSNNMVWTEYFINEGQFIDHSS